MREENSDYGATILIIALNGIFFFLYVFGFLDRHLSFLTASPQDILNGNVISVFTSGLIHLDAMHLFLNMAGVFIFGRIVERHFGFSHTLWIYAGALAFSIFLAGLIYAVMRQDVIIIGASGGLMGLIACAMLLEPFTITFEMLLPLPVMLKGWLFIYADVMGFLGGEKDNVSHLAHLCGFASVAFLVYFLNREERREMFRGLWVNIFSFAAFLIEQWFRKGA